MKEEDLLMLVDEVTLEFSEPNFTLSVSFENHLPDDDDTYWRFESYVSFGANAQVYVSVCAMPWKVVKQTPCGVKVARYEEIKQLYHHCHKKWAYPTREEAWNSFQIRINRRRLHWKTEGDRITGIEKAIAQYNNYLATKEQDT